MNRNLLGVALAIWIGLACAADSSDGDVDREPIPSATAGLEFGTLSALAPPETAHWGQLAGVWQCVVSTPGADGRVTESRATWTWRYILDGHAVQDVYVGHRAEGLPDFYGTGVRIYHPATATWEISWLANTPGAAGAARTTRFTAMSSPNEVVMRRGNGDPDWRTVFYDIREESFAWRSHPSGQTMTCARESG